MSLLNKVVPTIDVTSHLKHTGSVYPAGTVSYAMILNNGELPTVR